VGLRDDGDQEKPKLTGEDSVGASPNKGVGHPPGKGAEKFSSQTQNGTNKGRERESLSHTATGADRRPSSEKRWSLEKAVQIEPQQDTDAV